MPRDDRGADLLAYAAMRNSPSVEARGVRVQVPPPTPNVCSDKGLNGFLHEDQKNPNARQVTSATRRSIGQARLVALAGRKVAAATVGLAAGEHPDTGIDVTAALGASDLHPGNGTARQEVPASPDESVMLAIAAGRSLRHGGRGRLG